jgi:hypothetical protein
MGQFPVKECKCKHSLNYRQPFYKKTQKWARLLNGSKVRELGRVIFLFSQAQLTIHMDFRKLNLITGWGVFLVATIVYILTIEPTTSFWDTGEFITTAYKLEIGHPPGAPLFMLLARLFSMFVSVENVPMAVNVLSAVSSSLTILFLFWTITHFGRKMALKGEDAANNSGKIIATMAAGVVGALTYTFSDSFWFSAVEGEVYAMSSLFTAAVFWSILRWESLSNGKNEMRWIIVIAYLMGLSIGVHLLNLLAIPAICFVVYFKRNKPTTKGIIFTGLVSLVILGVIQAGIIPGVVSLAGDFELFFVNTLGMPFNTGTIVYALISIAILTFGLYYTHKNNKPVWNTVVLSVVVIILGYSTFATIVIRSSANPPLDENNPENVFTLLSYLNREQYGDRPLLYGHSIRRRMHRIREATESLFMQKRGQFRLRQEELSNGSLKDLMLRNTSPIRISLMISRMSMWCLTTGNLQWSTTTRNLSLFSQGCTVRRQTTFNHTKAGQILKGSPFEPSDKMASLPS